MEGKGIKGGEGVEILTDGKSSTIQLTSQKIIQLGDPLTDNPRLPVVVHEQSS
jgi:hypothetical protein